MCSEWLLLPAMGGRKEAVGCQLPAPSWPGLDHCFSRPRKETHFEKGWVFSFFFVFLKIQFLSKILLKLYVGGWPKNIESWKKVIKPNICLSQVLLFSNAMENNNLYLLSSAYHI